MQVAEWQARCSGWLQHVYHSQPASDQRHHQQQQQQQEGSASQSAGAVEMQAHEETHNSSVHSGASEVDQEHQAPPGSNHAPELLSPRSQEQVFSGAIRTFHSEKGWEHVCNVHTSKWLRHVPMPRCGKPSASDSSSLSWHMCIQRSAYVKRCCPVHQQHVQSVVPVGRLSLPSARAGSKESSHVGPSAS